MSDIISKVYDIIDMLIWDSAGQVIPEAITILFKCLWLKMLSACFDIRNYTVSIMKVI